MEELIEQDRAFAPRSVKDELERGDDDLFKWTKRQHEFFVEENEDVQRRVAQLMAAYYDPLKPAKGINGADPFVIALAATQYPPWVVVTDEHAGSQENPKIPYVCKQLKVGCISFLDLWRTEGWQLK